MNNSFIDYIGNGILTVFTTPLFEGGQSTVEVYLDTVLQVGGGTDYTLDAGAQTVTFVVAPPNLSDVHLQRETDVVTKDIVFTNTNLQSPGALNLVINQLFRTVQELQDNTDLTA